MRKVTCDLHLHSCLSPCGDIKMTPASVAGFSSLSGVQVAALTDHNTTANCPAFFEACKTYGIFPIAGMELTTAEDIHLICLFKSLEKAFNFEKKINEKRFLLPNKPEIFGRQLVMDVNDNIIREEKNLLINGTGWSLSEANEICSLMDGVCYPAHVDRVSNGIIGILGTFPKIPYFPVAEFRDPSKIAEYIERYENLQGLKYVYGSDAHTIDMIPDKATFTLEVEEKEDLAGAVLDYLKEI